MADKKTSITDKVLKRKKDPELQKQLQSEQIDFEAKEEKPDEIQELVQKSKIQETAKAKRKKNFRLGMIAIGALVLSYIGYWLFKPFEAGMDFGFCRVFLEQNVQYPQHLVLSEVEQRKKFVRIWYLQTDSFGQDRLENIECWHGQDPKRGYYISKVRVDRREIDPAKVELFNKSLTTIVAYPPDLTRPRRLRDALGNIDIQTYLFRKPIF